MAAETVDSRHRTARPMSKREARDGQLLDALGAVFSPLANTDDDLGHDVSREEFDVARRQVIKAGARVRRARQRLKEKRIGWGEVRERTAELETKVFQRLEEGVGSSGRNASPSSSSLAVLLEELRRSRDMLKAYETGLDRMEDAVAKEEYWQQEEESHFYDTYLKGMFREELVDHEPHSRTQSPTPTHVVESDPHVGPPTNPLDDYYSQVGDANILRERLDELVYERDEYAQEKAHLDSVGEEMEQVYLDFLNDFDEVYKKTLSDLSEIEKNILALEPPLLSNGILSRADAYSYEQQHLVYSPPPLSQEEGEEEEEALESEAGVSKPEPAVERWNVPIPGSAVRTVSRNKKQQHSSDARGLPQVSKSPISSRVEGWLKGMPGVTRSVWKIAKGDNTWMRGLQYCGGLIGKLKKSPTGERMVLAAEAPTNERLQDGYVHVDKTRWAQRTYSSSSPAPENEMAADDPNFDRIKTSPSVIQDQKRQHPSSDESDVPGGRDSRHFSL